MTVMPRSKPLLPSCWLPSTWYPSRNARKDLRRQRHTSEPETVIYRFGHHRHLPNPVVLNWIDPVVVMRCKSRSCASPLSSCLLDVIAERWRRSRCTAPTPVVLSRFGGRLPQVSPNIALDPLV